MVGIAKFLVTNSFLIFLHFFVFLRAHRTKWDMAEELEWLVMHHFKGSKKVTIIWNNLNTHTKGALYQMFPPEYWYGHNS